MVMLIITGDYYCINVSLHVCNYRSLEVYIFLIKAAGARSQRNKYHVTLLAELNIC